MEQQKSLREIQSEMIEQAENDLIAAGIDKKIVDDVYEGFLEHGHRFRPFKAQVVDGKPGIKFDLENGYFSAVFNFSDGTWEWELNITALRNSDVEPYKLNASYAGPGYRYDSKEFTRHDGVIVPAYTKWWFFLPDEVLKHITLKDEFLTKYEPMFRQGSHGVRILWHTGYWDGPLSGYCEVYRHGMCYFDNVDESDFDRKRMYAIYKLSTQDQIKAWVSHYKWEFLVRTPYYQKLWKYREWRRQLWRKLTLRPKHMTTAEITKRRKDFLEKMKPRFIGYFEG